jgi:hypothetical protein
MALKTRYSDLTTKNISFNMDHLNKKVLHCEFCGVVSTVDGIANTGILSFTCQRIYGTKEIPWFCSPLCCNMKKKSTGINSMTDNEYERNREHTFKNLKLGSLNQNEPDENEPKYIIY